MPRLFSIAIFRFMTSIIFLLIVSACAQPVIVSEVQPDGSLDILEPGPRFAEKFGSGLWISSGDVIPGSLVLTEKSGKRALLIPPGEQEFTILRPMDVVLLSTSYFGWSWLMEHRDGDFHDISILVGFRSPPEAPEQASFYSLPDAAEATQANRAVGIRWAASALRRGDLAPAGADDGGVPFYVVRGGRENTGRWWPESVDLSALYARLWPDEDLARARIVFVAINAGPDRMNSPAYIADMRLFR